MVYNISFSFPKDDPIAKDVLKGVARSFRCTGAAGDLTFQNTLVSVSTRTNLKLPKGFEKIPSRDMIYRDIYVKMAGSPPRPAAAIKIFRQAGVPIRLPDGVARDEEELLSWIWKRESATFRSEKHSPKIRKAKFGAHKGMSLHVECTTKDGVAGEVFVFLGKAGREWAGLTIVAEAREVRLYRKYFKEICSRLEFRK